MTSRIRSNTNMTTMTTTLKKKNLKKKQNPNHLPLSNIDPRKRIFRLFEFNMFDTETEISDSDSDEGNKKSKSIISSPKKDKSTFRVQMFGINEWGETCMIYVD